MAKLSLASEASRIRQAYAQRDAAGKPLRYDWKHADSLYMDYRKKVAWSQALHLTGLPNLSELEILDVGCGNGGWLRMFVEWGASPARLHGVDLLPDRIGRARSQSPPNMDFKVGNACELDYPDSTFDLGAASAVFSSILDPLARLALAQEMARVIRPEGWVAVFDFAISHPRNPDTVGMRKSEVCCLFPEMTLRETLKLILPPPFLRRWPSKWLGLAHSLELLFPFLCTHRLYLLQRGKARPA